MELRNFPKDVEVIASSWRRNVITVDPWKPTGIPGAAGGEAQGYYVTSGTVNAYAKPSKLDPLPKAAHEKIASDLAFDIGLPVPPATLLNWGKPPVGDQPHVVLSLIPFLSVHKWGEIKAVPSLEAQLKQEMRSVASAIVPFDTWLGNQDRVNNDGNILVSKDKVDPATKLGVVYVDFSNSMLVRWRSSDFETVDAIGIYPIDPKDVDISAMDVVTSKIETMQDEEIKAVVNGLPNEFIDDSDRRIVQDALLFRKSNIRAALKKIYGAL